MHLASVPATHSSLPQACGLHQDFLGQGVPWISHRNRKPVWPPTEWPPIRCHQRPPSHALVGSARPCQARGCQRSLTRLTETSQTMGQFPSERASWRARFRGALAWPSVSRPQNSRGVRVMGQGTVVLGLQAPGLDQGRQECPCSCRLTWACRRQHCVPWGSLFFSVRMAGSPV